jgi:hypothetical protein
MSSTKQIPWPRVIAEGAVIVVSILLAFGIDAWWEGRQERAEEGRYITALLDEAYAAADELEIDRQARDVRLAALDSLQLYFTSGRGRPDAFTSWVNESSSLANFFPPTAAYDDLVSSGGLQLLTSDELRLALMSYHQERPRLQFLEERERITVDDDLRPYLLRNFPLDVETAPASVVSRLAGDQEFRSLIEVRRRRLTMTIYYQDQLGESLVRLTEILAQQANPN